MFLPSIWMSIWHKSLDIKTVLYQNVTQEIVDYFLHLSSGEFRGGNRHCTRNLTNLPKHNVHAKVGICVNIGSHPSRKKQSHAPGCQNWPISDEMYYCVTGLPHQSEVWWWHVIARNCKIFFGLYNLWAGGVRNGLIFGFIWVYWINFKKMSQFSCWWEHSWECFNCKPSQLFLCSLTAIPSRFLKVSAIWCIPYIF